MSSGVLLSIARYGEEPTMDTWNREELSRIRLDLKVLEEIDADLGHHVIYCLESGTVAEAHSLDDLRTRPERLRSRRRRRLLRIKESKKRRNEHQSHRVPPLQRSTRLPPRASRLASRASRLASRASRLAPRVYFVIRSGFDAGSGLAT